MISTGKGCSGPDTWVRTTALCFHYHRVASYCVSALDALSEENKGERREEKM